MLELINISKTFNPGTVNERKALNNISLKVSDGDFITIIGANGSGKTTLFNAIAGSIITDEGRIVLDEKDITLLPVYKRAKMIGRLFQDPLLGTSPNMTIAENLTLACKNGGWLSRITAKDYQYFQDKLAVLDMDLENRMDQPVGLLSGGQRQALSLMMATINPPQLLLLDEHTAALDPGSGEKVLEITKKVVKENNLTCLMITHNMQSALDLGNRTLMMNSGKVVLDISGEVREKATVNDLLEMFSRATKEKMLSDEIILSQAG